MAAPAINPNRKPYNGKDPHDVKKVHWVRVRRYSTNNKPENDVFKFQPKGVEREIKNG